MFLPLLVSSLLAPRRPLTAPSRCIALRYRDGGCGRCQEVCPGHCIELEDGLRIGEGCDGCQLCAAACPTEALVSNPSWAKNLLRGARRKPFILTCGKTEAAATATMVSCLAGISCNLLITLALVTPDSSLVLYCNRQDECERLAGLLEKNVAAVNSFLQDLSLEKTYFLVRHEKSLLKPQPEAGYSRREVLFSWQEKGLALVQDALVNLEMKLVPGLEGKKKRDGDGFPPLEHLLLRGLLEGLSLTVRELRVGPATPWGNWRIDGNCSGCEKCVALCPAGALTSSRVQDGLQIQFRAGDCLNCQLCRRSCPRQAISREEKVLLEDITSRRVRTLRQHPLACCESCGEEFIPGGNQGKCSSCLKREEVKKAAFA